MRQTFLAALVVVLAVLVWPDSASAACLTRNFDNVPQVPVEQRGLPLQIVAADEDVVALEARGFRASSCTGELADRAGQIKYRNALCAFVADVNELIEGQTERALGAPPAQLCLSAEKVVGPWNGELAPVDPSKSVLIVVDGESGSIGPDMEGKSGGAK